LSSGLTIAPACSGVETNYTAASATAGTSFAWSRAAVAGISNVAATGTGNIKETLTNTGTTPASVNYVYTLTANTCTNTQTVATTINPKPATPIITALGPTTFCVEESVDLQVATVSGATYNWYLNGSNLGVNAATATVNIEGAYTASITNTFGCTSATSNAVAITTPCTSGISGMPTVFTPNGDGENDELFAVIPGIKELNKFSIYNRWGNVVFDTKVIGTAWDGKFKDVDQPADVYFWYVEGIDGNGNIYKKQGKVVLAR
jgi:gliding motility-associated-like protein